MIDNEKFEKIFRRKVKEFIIKQMEITEEKIQNNYWCIKIIEASRMVAAETLESYSIEFLLPALQEIIKKINENETKTLQKNKI